MARHLAPGDDKVAAGVGDLLLGIGKLCVPSNAMLACGVCFQPGSVRILRLSVQRLSCCALLQQTTPAYLPDTVCQQWMGQ